MANLLINKAKVSSLLQVAIGVPDSDFNKYIDEAQKFDLKEIVCEDFYYDLLKKKDEENYQNVIDGFEYQYESKTYSHEGIGAVIAYFAYARFQLNSPVVSTSHGMITKTNPFSTPVDLEERRNIYYKKREEANMLMRDVIKFIERNIESYPNWDCNSKCNNERRGSFTTRVIQ